LGTCGFHNHKTAHFRAETGYFLSLGADVIIGSAEIKLCASWVLSLREKRMVVKSMIAKTQNKFNVSIAGVKEQDTFKTVVLGIAWVTSTVRQADSI